MATGDAVVVLSSVASGTVVTYQPAPGVEVCVTQLISGLVGSATSQTFGVTDGTISAILYYGGNDKHIEVKCFITNAKYLYMTQNSGSVAIMGFSGVQTKG